PFADPGYLALDQLRSAQQPKSSEHDEMLFIVIHQIYELWFKQLLHEFGKAQAELEAGSTTHAMRTLRRTPAILKIVGAQLDVLETMTPTQFTRFRDWLPRPVRGVRAPGRRLLGVRVGGVRGEIVRAGQLGPEDTLGACPD